MFCGASAGIGEPTVVFGIDERRCEWPRGAQLGRFWESIPVAGVPYPLREEAVNSRAKSTKARNAADGFFRPG